MASSFMGLYVQRDALLISQKCLDITGNNISNIETGGYARQRVDICSIANARGTLGYKTSISLAGKGARAIGVAQVRNRLADKKVRDWSGELCNYGVKTSVLSEVEDLFDSIEQDAGTSQTSLKAMLGNLKAALQSFSADDADRTEMANIVINAARSLAQNINNIDARLNTLEKETITDTKETVDNINDIFSEMASLNRQIKDAYVSMGYIQKTNGNYEVMNDYGPLELKDKMHLLLDQLSQYGNIDYKEEADGTFTVDFAGQRVVEGRKYAQMAMAEENPRPTELAFVITQVERNVKGEIIGGLYEKDEWYDMHVKNGTGGDAQMLVRKSMREPIGIYGEQVKTFDFSGKRASGTAYLTTGSLRGLLDVYNGRKTYADDYDKTKDESEIYQVIRQQVEMANRALDDIAGLNFNDQDDIDKFYDLVDILQDNVGAKFEMDPETGDYKMPPVITIAGLKVYDEDEGITGVQLEVINPNDPARLGNAQIVTNDGEFVRQIAINDTKGIEYYRDMLNAFAKTITTEFNKIFAGHNYKEKNPDYDPTDPDSEEYIDTGRPFEMFTYDDNIYTKDDPSLKSFRRAAGTFRVADDWLNDPMFIANPTKDNQYEELDNSYINKLLGIFSEDAAPKFSYSDDFGHGIGTEHTLEKYLEQISADVAHEVKSNGDLYEASDISLTLYEEDRSGDMDVAMNEEGVNMMNYQKWYNAISRMISTMDEALDKLINQTGLVGLR